MSVATDNRRTDNRIGSKLNSSFEQLQAMLFMLLGLAQQAINADDTRAAIWEAAAIFKNAGFGAQEVETEVHVMGQMGAKRIGSLAIGIGVVGIVLNQMSDLAIVGNSTGVIDVSGIFETAGAGLNLLVVGVIIAAAAVLLSLWSGF